MLTLIEGHLHDDDLQLYATGRLASDSIEIINEHVRICPSCAARLEEAALLMIQAAQQGGFAKRRGERRTEHRIPTAEVALLQILQPLSLERLRVGVFDTSRNGLGVRVQVRLDPGTLVQVRIQQTVALGEVRYCIAAEGGFQAGILVEDLHQISGREI